METKRTPQEKFVGLYDTAKKCLLILDHLYRKIEEGSAAAEVITKVDAASPEGCAGAEEVGPIIRPR